MAIRLGPGPVFAYEWLTTTRRWQVYALRALFVGLILAGMAIVHNGPQRGRPERLSLRQLAAYGEQLYQTMVSIELTLILLVAPAATAGAVCLDKARGTLDHMLTTDLSNAEIVLGKLAVRLIPVLGLVASVFPVVALAGLLGGIGPLALVGSFLVSIGCAFVGCSLALTLSIYGRKTHEVLILTYLIIILWLMAPALVMIAHRVLVGGPPPWAFGMTPWKTLYDWVEATNPYSLVYAPYSSPGKVGMEDYLGFLAGCWLCSAGLTGLAMARIRGVALSQVGRPAGRAGWRLPKLPRLGLPRRPLGPSLDGNPVAWREWHRARPLTMMRVAWGIYAALGLLWVWMASRSASGPGGDEEIALMNMFQVTVGLLLLSVTAATSLAEERVRGSLDVLLSTPMLTRSILAGKWWGTFRGVLWVVIWPAATTIFLVLDGGYWRSYLVLLGLVLAYGAAITSLGLAVATWVSRLGRAIALCVTAYVALVIGWPMLLIFGLGGSGFIESLILADPLFGSLALTMAASAGPIGLPGRPSVGEIFSLGLAWVVIHSGLAAVLFWATLATFDRCLGRTSDDGSRPPPRRLGRSSRAPARPLALVLSSEDEP